MLTRRPFLLAATAATLATPSFFRRADADEAINRENYWRRHIVGSHTVEKDARGQPVAQFHDASAVQEMTAYLNQGYDLSAYLTAPIVIDNETFVGRKSPATMCVGAVYEAFLRALRLARLSDPAAPIFEQVQASEFNTTMFRTWMFGNAFANIPKLKNGRRHSAVLHFAGRDPQQLDDRAASNGASDAFVVFGIGERVPLSAAEPGDFITFNRSNGTGHAAILLRFIGSDGTYSESYEASSIGFIYFSSQGSTRGLSVREEFFSDSVCPAAGRCQVQRVDDGELLSVARLLPPTKWTAYVSWRRERRRKISAAEISIAEAQRMNATKEWEKLLPPSSEFENEVDPLEQQFDQIDPTLGLNVS